MYRYLLTRRDGAVEYATLNRPESRNAFNPDVIQDLTAWAAATAADTGVRVAVLSGAGPAFCAGADVNWMAGSVAYTEEENRQDALRLAGMLGALDTLPVPLIGRIHGPALGGGTGLTAVCDIVIASDDALFGFTEVRLGIIPAVISPFAMQKVGLSAARRYFLTGERFGAGEALRLGLVHEVVPIGELDAKVDALVKAVLSSGPDAVRTAKALIPRVVGRGPADVRTLTAEHIARQRVSPEGREGLTAFLEKRKPGWIQ